MILCNTLTYPIDADTAKHLTSIIKTTPLLKETKEEFQERISKGFLINILYIYTI
jgi:hypothetical protein